MSSVPLGGFHASRSSRYDGPILINHVRLLKNLISGTFWGFPGRATFLAPPPPPPPFSPYLFEIYLGHLMSYFSKVPSKRY